MLQKLEPVALEMGEKCRTGWSARLVSCSGISPAGSPVGNFKMGKCGWRGTAKGGGFLRRLGPVEEVKISSVHRPCDVPGPCGLER